MSNLQNNNINTKKRALQDSMDSTDGKENGGPEGYQLNEIMSGISNIQNTLANFMLRLDSQGRQMDELAKEVQGRDGIQERLELVQEQANDTVYSVTEINNSQEIMSREISRLKDYVIKLEFRVNVQEKQILELKSRSMENNVIISGLDEKPNENLASAVRDAFMQELDLGVEEVDSFHILNLFRLGEKDPTHKRKYPRPICIQFGYKTHKDKVMSRVRVLKEKKSHIRLAVQQPEEIREKRKRLYDIQKKYSAKNVETKIKGDKLIFTKSGNVYRDKTGTRPTAEEVISGDQVKITVNKGKHIEDNQNRFESHATAVNSYKQVKESLIEILRLPTISSASHNVYAYRFAGSDGMVHEGSEDDGEHGAGRTLLSAMNDNGIQNALIVVSRWFGNKIGMRRFTHIVDAGLSAGKNINPS